MYFLLCEQIKVYFLCLFEFCVLYKLARVTRVKVLLCAHILIADSDSDSDASTAPRLHTFNIKHLSNPLSVKTFIAQGRITE